MKVLHVLYQSLPQVSGSSIRSRDIMMSQQEIGIDVVAVTSVFQNSINGGSEDNINGIRYIRTSREKEASISDLKKTIFKRLSRVFSIITFGIKLYGIIKKEKPEVIHAHAMFYCGIPSIIIGKVLKIPVVYEFRSLWMYQKSNSVKGRLEIKIEEILYKIEAYTLRKSDFAIFLNKKLMEYVSEKGTKIINSEIINNAVNTTLIKKAKSNNALFGKKEFTFGYIGTLTAYEGIEFLIETFQKLSDLGIKNKLIIYGDGISKKSVIKSINKRKDIKSIKFMGSISPDEVYLAFNEINVIINPRLKNNITDSVTPLKPLEAMAYEKIVIGSDVGGISEIITDGFNGMIFKAENQEDLIRTVKKCINLSEVNQEELVKRSLDYVVNNKSWLGNAKRYFNIYDKLINKVKIKNE